MAKFLDYDGLLYFWSKIKAAFVAKESGKGLSTNDYTTTEKNKLAGIASGAEVNQNAYTTVKVGSTNVTSASKTGTLELAAGSNVTLTPDATNKKVTIASANTTYTGTSPITVSGTAISHANSGVTAASKGDTSNQTPAFGATFKALSGTVNATGHLTAFAEHTVKIPNAAATQSASGLMSAADKAKLDGVATGATKVIVDDDFDSESSNPLENKLLDEALARLNKGFKVFYGTSTTAAATTAKVATVDAPGTSESGKCSDINKFSLVNGAMVCVTFSTTNTGAVGSLTLNVNNTGAKAIKYFNNSSLGNLLSASMLCASVPILFIYNGSYWVATGLNFNTTYSNMSLDEANTGTATSGRAITAKVLSDYVTGKISTAVAGITQFRYEIMPDADNPPANPEIGVIYLVPHSHGDQDIYDEYIYIQQSQGGTITGSFEKIGSTDIDLSGYWAKTALTAITNSEIDTIVAS